MFCGSAHRLFMVIECQTFRHWMYIGAYRLRALGYCIIGIERDLCPTKPIDGRSLFLGWLTAISLQDSRVLQIYVLRVEYGVHLYLINFRVWPWEVYVHLPEHSSRVRPGAGGG
jgi:hypothetical protein